MSDSSESNDPQPVHVDFGPTLDRAKAEAKAPIQYSPLTDEYQMLIGRIATCWAVFEDNLQQLSAAITSASGEQLPEHSRFFPFKSRLINFKKLYKAAFAETPTILSVFDNIARDTSALQEKRNALLHGQLSFRIRVTGAAHAPVVSYTIRVNYRKNREAQELTLDKEALDDLFYDTANLAGRTAEFWQKKPQIALSAEDIAILHTFFDPAKRPPDFPSAESA